MLKETDNEMLEIRFDMPFPYKQCSKTCSGEFVNVLYLSTPVCGDSAHTVNLLVIFGYSISTATMQFCLQEVFLRFSLHGCPSLLL